MGLREVAVDLREVLVEAPLGALELPLARDRAADGEDEDERHEDAQQDGQPGRHAR